MPERGAISERSTRASKIAWYLCSSKVCWSFGSGDWAGMVGAQMNVSDGGRRGKGISARNVVRVVIAILWLVWNKKERRASYPCG